ncbi:histidine kinase [Rheinheimera sp. MMS21-TC3]|uniref:GAF domain-containing protein n=1 Tax=Rheinheimera sp. MMS21-TC3 TaxID=3072790 RepID=UPI0028C4083E|nr:histidine kinase [Rheinheimera sp. MMS21-TC3]WNO61482.1 histidine kinase [Rheinheimera sp. MMS21-TC3]
MNENVFAIDTSSGSKQDLVADYLQLSGLLVNYADLVKGIAPLVRQYQLAMQQFLTKHTVDNLRWQYQVPELGEGGACSIFAQLQPEPYDLTHILPDNSAQTEQALSKLQALTNYYQQQSGLDWFGIYQARLNSQGDKVLVKLAYYGAASRAEFPLNAEFAKHSNNSTVGLSGIAKIINNVADYVASGGEYYTCDPKVNAEACLPLFDQSGKIVGIIDAEDFNNNVFTTDAIALLVAICITVPQYLP